MKSEGGPGVVPNEKDYAAAEDAEVGKKKPGNYEAGMLKAEPFDCGLPWRDIITPAVKYPKFVIPAQAGILLS